MSSGPPLLECDYYSEGSGLSAYYSGDSNSLVSKNA
jgi:hypothetical protein